MSRGTLAFVGGGEFSPGCDFDAALLGECGAAEVVVLPTATAYENPAKLRGRAEGWFEALGAGCRWLDVYRRADAADAGAAAAVREARMVYLTGGSPLHARSTLLRTAVWEALAAASAAGATVVGAGAGGNVLCDFMVDVRGGAFTLGLGLTDELAMISRADTLSAERISRTVRLAPPGLLVAAVDERSALIRRCDRWEVSGDVVLYRDGARIGPEGLPE
ncbi:MAG: Type 1 glutamine amidotransferase-like domain-containing protein [bacterium]|nr:Type 1 glutamine amidotransferase-like domain-containing protein [bacterium]MCY3925679.1 Type 1 glutamine amidotransferase-like domain-containing protein [bacterium]